MKYLGQCDCGQSELIVQSDMDLATLVPRKCDCSHCQSLELPIAMISDPLLHISLEHHPSELNIKKNGSKQASFYHCRHCDQLLAVSADIDGERRGAINAYLFGHVAFREAILVQPRLLSPNEKIARWKEIWGYLSLN